MSTQRRSTGAPGQSRRDTPREPFHSTGFVSYEIPEEAMTAEHFIELTQQGVHQFSPWHHGYSVFGNEPAYTPSGTQEIGLLTAKLESLEQRLDSAVKIGLENRKLLEQLLERETRVGLGAIHSLDDGRVQLSHPLVYGYEIVDDEVVVSIEDIGIYGVGATEWEAVQEAQAELWSLFQDLERTPTDNLGTQLISALRTLKARIRANAVDA